MEAKNNMKQAMYEMFGVGSDQTAEAEAVETPAYVPAEKKAARSVLAEGTSVEGTLYTDGDIEVLGTVKGDITAKGKVKIGNVCASNIKANTLEIFGGEVTGDVNVTDTVYIGKGTKLCGNITAQELVCAGVISGNITVTQGVTLEATAKVTGDVTADSISIAKGAFIRGGIEIKSASVGKIN